MDICIDTNVFSHKNFLRWLAEKEIEAYLPSIAYMECSYHEMKTRDGSLANFISMIRGLGITIVPFDDELALIAAKNATANHDLKENARDYAIGAFAYRRKIPVITNNKKPFKYLKEVYTPDEFMKKF